jgi:hypothetical protein
MALVNVDEVVFGEESSEAPTEAKIPPPRARSLRYNAPTFDDDNDYITQATSKEDKDARVYMTASNVLMPALRSVLSDDPQLLNKPLSNEDDVELVLSPCAKICMKTLTNVNELRSYLEDLGLDVVNVRDQWPLRRLLSYVSLLSEHQHLNFGKSDDDLTLALFNPVFEAYKEESIKPVIDKYGDFNINYNNELMLLNKILSTTNKIVSKIDGSAWITNNSHCITDMINTLVTSTCEGLKKHNLNVLSKEVQRQLVCRTIDDVSAIQYVSLNYEDEVSKTNDYLPSYPAKELSNKIVKYSSLFRGVQGKLMQLVYSILAKGNEFIVDQKENEQWSKRMNFIDVVFPIIKVVAVDRNLTLEDKQAAIKSCIAKSHALYGDVVDALGMTNLDSQAKKQVLSFSIDVLSNTERSNVSVLEAPSVYVGYVKSIVENPKVLSLIDEVATLRGVKADIIASTLIKSMFPLMASVSVFNYFESNRKDVVCNYAYLALKHLKDDRVLSQLSGNIDSDAKKDLSVINKELDIVFSSYTTSRHKSFLALKADMGQFSTPEKVVFVKKIQQEAHMQTEQNLPTKSVGLVNMSENYFINNLPVFSIAIRQFADQLRDDAGIELEFMGEARKTNGLP